MSSNIIMTKTSVKKTARMEKGVEVDSSKYWRLATVVLFAVIVFMFFFDVEIESKFGNISTPELDSSSVSTQGAKRPSTRSAPAPQGGGGCGV